MGLGEVLGGFVGAFIGGAIFVVLVKSIPYSWNRFIKRKEPEFFTDRVKSWMVLWGLFNAFVYTVSSSAF